MQQADGYLADLPYPPHFHKELLPLSQVAIAHFLQRPAPSLDQPFSYCELGCGMGINLLVAAATNPNGYFVGVDINARHIEIARAAVSFSGLSNIHFVQADFSSFAQEQRFYFDFIACHGTWSWIAAQHQEHILQIVQQSLKPAGLFYLHYMTHPGATYLIPLQRLLNDYAQQVAGTGIEKITQAMNWLQQLVSAGAFIDQPQMAQHIQALAQKEAHYLAHEFLTEHWRPQHSSEVHQQLAQAGLEYAGSANALENMDALSVPGNLQPLLAGLATAAQENLRDLSRNQRQRTDLFQKIPASNTANAQITNSALLNTRFQLLPTAPVAGGFNFNTPIGAIPAPADIFTPLLQTLAHHPATLAELQQLPLFAQQPELLAQALQMLMWAEHVHPQHRALPSGKRNAPQALATWITQHSLALQLIENCGTAIKTKG